MLTPILGIQRLPIERRFASLPKAMVGIRSKQVVLVNLVIAKFVLNR
jgi:hypothetical protein